jgi:fatty acid amide hydrolase 2
MIFFRSREIRSQQLIEVYIRRIESIGGLLNAIVQENFDSALEAAKDVDEYLDQLDPASDEFKNVCLIYTIHSNAYF